MSDQNNGPSLVGLTSEIVAAYVAHNSLGMTHLPSLIQQVHQSLIVLAKGVADEAPPEVQTPAVPIKKSYTADAITCLDCGNKFKSLKRHINSDHDLTPDQYRAKWKLPNDYPMVSPAYSQRRSELAKTHGLGRLAGEKRA
ncbi:MucR family transcriptional regulator [Devosia sp. 1635]|uniref:MucR family transcriptional regulator n=1 Tax=Devosia sp. 1635 TaxID=2726066 RepID=UPI001564FD13